ncbi:Protein of unknown function [Pyronema omphalodes CBS 100304]|nr:Protein of unknown function [Pyronema omphalodes CBS 100304]
MLSYIR